MEGPLGSAHKYLRSSPNTQRARDEDGSVLAMTAPADNSMMGGAEERCSNKRSGITSTKKIYASLQKNEIGIL